MDLKALAAAGAYAAAIGFFAWPLSAEPGSALADPARMRVAASGWARADLDLLVWILAWVAHALRTQPWAIFQANIFHPAPDALASSEHLLGLAPVAAPVFLLSGNAVLTYNLTSFAVVWISALGMFALVRAWTGDAAAAFLAGAVFAFSPSGTGAWIRLHVSAVHLFPLVLLFAWRVARLARPGDAALLALLTGIQLLSGAYVGFELAALLAAFTPTLWILSRGNHRARLAVALSIAAGALIAAPSALPYLRVRAGGQLPSYENSLHMVTFSAPDPAGFLRLLRWETTLPAMVLAALALVLPKAAPRAVKLGLALTALLGGVLTVGPRLSLVPGTGLPSLYEFAMRVVPGFAGMRTSTRFVVLPIFATSALAGIACARISAWTRARWPGTRRARLAPFGVAMLGVALIVGRQPLPPVPVSRVDVTGPETAAHRWLGEQRSSGAVVELPVANSPLDGGALPWTGRAMLGATIHWKPLLNGYSGHPPPSLQTIMTLAQRLPDARAADALCDLAGLEWIVAHFGVMPGEEARWFTPEALAVAEPVARFGSDAVFRLRRRCAPGPTGTFDRLVDAGAERTVGGTPLAPLNRSDVRASFDAELPTSMPPGRYAWVPLEVTNRGTTAWPGLSAVSPWAVLLQSRWRDATTGQVAVSGEAIPLATDVAPGERVRAQVNVLAPNRPGDYVLEIGLVQRGAGWLADDPGSDSVLRRPIRVAAPGVASS